MDSVPFAFCMDLMGHLNLDWGKYEKLANVLTGRWKAAANSFAENVHDLELRCKVEEGEWSYIVLADSRSGDKPFDEIVALNDRFIRCKYISIDILYEVVDLRPKEEILAQVIPFMAQHLRRSSGIYFRNTPSDLSEEEAGMLFGSLLVSHGFGLRDFGTLCLPYYGPESESFLNSLLDRGCSLQTLCLDTSWPDSQAVEDIIVELFTPRPKISLIIYPNGDKRNYILSAKIFEAIVNAWNKAENLSSLNVYGPWHAGSEEVLFVPVPPSVTRKLLKAQEENKSFTVWSKENGSTLSCTIDYTEHKIQFRSPPDDRFNDPDNLTILVSLPDIRIPYEV
uniref:SHSP domain-containing protein n=1 Tax=Steinernema glaseri TaxID=37863 RepID=A0A1I7YDN4_9BILA